MMDQSSKLSPEEVGEVLDSVAKDPSTFSVLAAAKVCHEANRAFCQTLNDFSQNEWFGAPQWQKDSAIRGVKTHFSNRGLTPKDSHDIWMSEKEADGWKYGPVKDAAAKIHPAMLPYDELPAETKAKDHLFRAVVHAFIDSGLL